MVSMKTIKIMFTLLLLSWLCALSVCGYAMTSSATNQSITIPITQWQSLKTEFQALNSELVEGQNDLRKHKKPSTQLVSELTQAQALLTKLNQDLEQQKQDLTLLSNELAESKTLLQTLKQQIDKERRVHRRQIWQNRLWCIIGGTAVGFAIGHASK